MLKFATGMTPEFPDHGTTPVVLDLIRRALEEDIGSGDVTSNALVPADHESRAVIMAKQDCIVSGLSVARLVFREVDSGVSFECLAKDAVRVDSGTAIAAVAGNTRSILAGERVALNFLQRMTGIATQVGEYVARVEQFGVAVLDTRKTMPTFRALEKYAVLCGGGRNHRAGLYDMILIKDNHRKIWECAGQGGLDKAVAAARASSPDVPIEIEVESLEDMRIAMREEPDWIMLDNMTVDEMKQCVELCGGKCLIEASGGITLDNIEAVAASGVNAVSVGALTHSVRAADLSLEIES